MTTARELGELPAYPDRLRALSDMLCEEYLSLTYTLRKGCMCGACNVFMLADSDGRVFAESETLTEAIDQASAKLAKAQP